jgi:hypothetical protein
VSEAAGIKPRTVATSAGAVRRSNHSAKSHPHLNVCHVSVQLSLSLTFWFNFSYLIIIKMLLFHKLYCFWLLFHLISNIIYLFIGNNEIHADFESVEKVVKNAPKKVISITSLTNMSKSEKSAFFRHVFANNFFWCIFSKLFQRIRNQREILRFLTPFLILKKFLGHISTFFKL